VADEPSAGLYHSVTAPFALTDAAHRLFQVQWPCVGDWHRLGHRLEHQLMNCTGLHGRLAGSLWKQAECRLVVTYLCVRWKRHFCAAADRAGRSQ